MLGEINFYSAALNLVLEFFFINTGRLSGVLCAVDEGEYRVYSTPSIGCLSNYFCSLSDFSVFLHIGVVIYIVRSADGLLRDLVAF